MPRHRRLLGQKVRLFRKLSGLTQEKLAEKATLAPSYLSDIERGRENISVDALHRLANAMDIEIGDFFEKSISARPARKQRRRPDKR